VGEKSVQCSPEGALVDKRTVAELNMKHFRRLLATETDPAKRETITKLLGEEEAKLRAINAERKRQRS
jgi:hypothetical protein